MDCPFFVNICLDHGLFSLQAVLLHGSTVLQSPNL